ncbi:MAG: segregation and condensation protein [Thermosediminibacterales bacterium]|nr:segregation and condensation protein [Thermosediminibacterales bacterium]
MSNTKQQKYQAIIEGLLFVNGEPLKLKKISEVLEINEEETYFYIKKLQEFYQNNNTGIELKEVAGGFQLVTKPFLKPYIEKLCDPLYKYSLSQASMETLAIILYKQPITKAEIESIRGVNVEKALRNLIDRNLIKEVDRLETPGRPILYGTTDECLKFLGLNTINELPDIKEFQKEETKT